MALSEELKRKAIEKKELGKNNFRNGFFETAIDNFTESLVYDDKDLACWTNRALCHKKLRQWNHVSHDARMALKFNENCLKANYLLALSLYHLGETEEAMSYFTRAQNLTDTSKTDLNYIGAVILSKKKEIWYKQYNRNLKLYETFRNQIQGLLQYCQCQNFIDSQEADSIHSHLDFILARTQKLEEPFELPDFMFCKITMGIIADPVVTSSGLTYERNALLDHFKRNGNFDPVTRKQCSSSDLISNFSFKKAEEFFLEKYPWAYENIGDKSDDEA